MFTEEQLSAIEEKGRVILSASAGSGKTTVMIEKIVRLVKEGLDFSNLLAVTYTKKAASQMKDKLRRELISAINEEGTPKETRERLKKQLAKVSSADISTIHSFCARLIRSHFFLADVNADFYIISEDSAEGVEIFDRAMDDLFEEAYDRGEEEFLELLGMYWRSKKDNNLKKIIASVYKKLRTYDDYTRYLKGGFVHSTEEKFNRICSELSTFFLERMAFYKRKVEDYEGFFEENGVTSCLGVCAQIKEFLSSLEGKTDYFELLSLPVPAFARMPSSKKMEEPIASKMKELGELKKEVRDQYKTAQEKLKPREEELENYLLAGKAMGYLAQYILRLDERYAEMKRAKNALDYNDLEHIALSLLSKESVKEEVLGKYSYVFVDEYQDVNPVQEKMIEALSGNNLFLVGDIKQAIYGFRGSKSVYFAQKQRRFEKDERSHALLLTKNFRSSDGVLEFVNEIFREIMTPSVSEVDYQKEGGMRGSERFGGRRGSVHCHVFTPLTQAEKERGVYSVEQAYLEQKREISAFAEQMRALVEKERNSTWYDADEPEEDKREKRVEYSDIAILTRKMRGEAQRVIEALTEAGIPVSSSSEINVCEFPEIKTLIDILSLIDNSEQDIPLCSALLSAMGNLTVEDLTEIRLAYPKEYFFRDACKNYANERSDERAFRLSEFFAYLEKLRAFASVADAGEVLSRILSETRMEAQLLKRDNGVACLKRIHFFTQQTLQNEPCSVHEFLSLLKALNFEIKRMEGSGENAVKVMTMHASKGLEYPVVILQDLSNPYRGESDTDVRFDEEFGVALKFHKRETFVRGTTLLWRLCEAREEKEEVKNELNLFYVALTRAKFRLHLTFSKPPKGLNVRYARSYADFIPLSTFYKHVGEENVFDLPKAERTIYAGKFDEAEVEKIVRAIGWKYPYFGGENLPVKTSASMRLKEEKTESRFVAQPLVLEDEREDKILLGLAYHAFLQRYDFHRPNEESVDKTLALMEESGLGEYVKALDKKQISNILQNPIFGELSQMILYKEQEFLASLQAKDVYSPEEYGSCGDEEILVQGAIDLLGIDEEGDAVIVDYKYSTAGEEELKVRYKKQLLLYKTVVQKLLRLDPSRVRTVIVNIRRGFEVEVIE